MKHLELIKAVAILDSGNSTYFDGDLNEVRDILNEIGSFYVSPVGNGLLKITKAKSSHDSFYGSIAKQLDAYNGKAVTISEDVQKVRMTVSRYNRTNNKTFSVRMVSASIAEIFSANLEDFQSITLDMFKQEVEKRRLELQRLRRLVHDADENALNEFENGLTGFQHVEAEQEQEDDQDEDLTPDPSIFVTRPHFEPLPEPVEFRAWVIKDCVTCDEEFSTQDQSVLHCEGCRPDDDDEIV